LTGRSRIGSPAIEDRSGICRDFSMKAGKIEKEIKQE